MKDNLLLTDDELLGNYYDKASPLDKDTLIEGLREVAKDQLDKVKQELCANCDTPLLREGELYQKLEQARKDERERIIREVEQLWRPQHHNLCYGSKPHPDCIRCKWQALKGEK